MEVLLSHIHSIVCDNDIEGIFLGCPKSCQMAAHNSKIHFIFQFMILHNKVSKIFRKVLSLIKKTCFMIQSHEFLQSFTWINMLFWFLKGWPPTFSNLGILLKNDMKNCLLLGKLLSVWRTVSGLSQLSQSALSAQTVENSHSFFNVSYTWYKSLHET